MEGKKVVPESVCSVGNDIFVYDSGSNRILAASDGKWGNVLLHEDQLGKIQKTLLYMCTTTLSYTGVRLNTSVQHFPSTPW